MSTKRSAGPGVPTQGTPRYAATRKKDRSTNLCAFTFADGRQCRTLRCSGHLHLCYFHAQKEAERLAAKQVGEDISRFLPAKLLTACDLSGAMARVFCAIARGDVKPKLASTLAYLSQSMVQSIPIAQHEYCEAFGSDAWRGEIRASFNVPAPQPKPAPQPTPKPAPQPSASAWAPPTPVDAGLQPGSSASSTSSTSSPASQPPTKPVPSPHTPLPPTSAEFAQQVLAGRNSSRAEVPTPSRPGRENGSSGSSSLSAPSSTCSSTNQTQATPAPRPKSAAPPSTPVGAGLQPGSSGSSSSSARSSDSAPAHTSSTQPAPSSPGTLPTPNNSQPAPAPPAPPSVPPGFGAPANWDVLIPPKPRRRFSRHWQLLE